MESKRCSKCGKMMIVKHGKYGNFWSCSGFPYCRNIENIKKEYKPAEPKKIDNSVFIPSLEQKNILDYIANNPKNCNIFIMARAGSGKTTTLNQIAKILINHGSVLYITFGKRLVNEAKDKIIDGVVIKTFNAKGLRDCSNNHKVIVDVEKTDKILKNYAINNPADNDVIKTNRSVITRLVSLLKNTMLQPNQENFDYLSDRFNIVTNGDQDKIYKLAEYTYNQSLALNTIVDYDDMVLYPASGLVPAEKFDYILIDETQDINQSNLALIEKSIKPNGSIIAVGDDWQAIFGFRGSDLAAVENIISKFSLKIFDLSVSRRCPQVIKELVNNRFPELKFDCLPEAIIGEINYNKESSFNPVIDSMVLCRNNAPLVKPALKLLSQGIKVVILGTEIAENLKYLIAKIENKYKCDSLTSLLDSLQLYYSENQAKLSRWPAKLEYLNDQIQSIEAIAQDDSVNTIDDIYKKIDNIFSDNTGVITFSSIHKAKGLESDNVYLLHPEIMPSKNAKKPEEIAQELHLIYVAWTRTKNKLTFIE